MMEDTAGGKSDPEVREYAGEILKSATSLIRLVGDMLDLSKMESGSETFLSEECDLADTVRSIVKEMAPFARERRVELAVMGGSVPVPIHTDPGKIRRAILNIVSNAVKFTPAGGSVTCSTFESAKGWGVSVQDTGIGIPKSDLDTIFEKFHQVENSLKRETAGSGLGLPIAKEIVERSGGKILVSSEP
jgi:two-component system phosphate regulon sensor histidine kinase PhoR